MYKIGEFSKLSKTTIKTLRYYDKENLLMPDFIDQNTGYRYYETKQLIELSKIMSLRQVGLSIKDIKIVLDGYDRKKILEKRKKRNWRRFTFIQFRAFKNKLFVEGG